MKVFYENVFKKNEILAPMFSMWKCDGRGGTKRTFSSQSWVLVPSESSFNCVCTQTKMAGNKWVDDLSGTRQDKWNHIHDQRYQNKSAKRVCNDEWKWNHINDTKAKVLKGFVMKCGGIYNGRMNNKYEDSPHFEGKRSKSESVENLGKDICIRKQ